MGLAGAGFDGAACFCCEGLLVAGGALFGLGFEAAACFCLGGLGLETSKARVDAEVCKPQTALSQHHCSTCDREILNQNRVGVV